MTRRGLLSILLIGAVSIPFGVQSGIDDRAAGQTDHATAPALRMPVTLNEAWAEAIAAAHRLKTSRTSSYAGRVTYFGEKTSLFPANTAEEGRFWSGESPSSVMSLPVLMGMPVAQDDQFWAGRVIATVPVFASGRILRGTDVSQADRRAIRAGKRRETLDLKLSVAVAYVEVLRASREAQAAASEASSLASHLQTVSSLCEEGFVPRADLTTSQAALDAARRRETQARTCLSLADASYNRLLLRPMDGMVTLEDLTPPSASEEVKELISRAFEKRPELAALAEEAESLRQAAMSLRAGTRPSIGISGSYNRLAGSFLERDQALTAGIVVTWRLFDRRETRQKASAADEKADDVSALLAQAMGAVSSQVRQASQELVEALRQLEATRGAIAQAEENLIGASEGYSTGTSVNSEVLDAESSRGKYIGDRNNAHYEAVMAGFKLGRAVGELNAD